MLRTQEYKQAGRKGNLEFVTSDQGMVIRNFPAVQLPESMLGKVNRNFTAMIQMKSAAGLVIKHFPACNCRKARDFDRPWMSAHILLTKLNKE